MQKVFQNLKRWNPPNSNTNIYSRKVPTHHQRLAAGNTSDFPSATIEARKARLR